MSPQGTARGNATSQTYADLRRDIVTGTLALGTSLLEGQLAERYGVSRTPVREALRRLEQDGLVARGSRGYEVRRYSTHEIFDIYEARILLEGHAARRAAQRHGDVDALRMREAHQRMVDLPDDADRENRVAANQRFHRTIWEAAGNRTVLDLLSRLYLNLVRHTTLMDPQRWQGAAEEHGRLLTAILAGRGDDAGRLMEEHIGHGRDLVLSQQAAAPEDPG